MAVTDKDIIPGGSFLIRDTPPQEVFTPEDLSDEQKMMGKVTREFVEADVKPKAEQIEHQDWDLTVKLFRKAGELGLLSVDLPTKYGGLGLDLITSVVIAERLIEGGSFAISVFDHVGIGSLPIAWFGNAEQKARYLPLLATGAKIGSYALTEPGSGSDALAAKTKAVLSPDGKFFILNGTKQFITNAAFADLYITYAKVDGDKFSAFIIDRDTPGATLGAEEKKMGIKGTSTRSVILDNAKVPVENLLYEVGKGHKVAFDILNIGRFKLAAGCLGTCKVALRESVKYAKQRTQFGQSIASFGLIQKKLAEMAIRTYVAESIVYRTGGLIEAILSGIDQGSEAAGLEAAKGVEEYAVECSINKVYVSEALDYVADVPRRTDLPGCEDQPHLRGDQRDQPAADPRHALPEGLAGAPSTLDRGAEVDGRPALLQPRSGRGAQGPAWGPDPNASVEQEDRADGVRRRRAEVPREPAGGTGDAGDPERPDDRALRHGERAAPGAQVSGRRGGEGGRGQV
ncbi:MAG: Acyl-CoA dehydrogenase [candidate division NC10 bacterium]|nr:Acyl-CoA dehydrogenase [candidate division NC10 bacterium]